jgi:hypothetical protein
VDVQEAANDYIDIMRRFDTVALLPHEEMLKALLDPEHPNHPKKNVKVHAYPSLQAGSIKFKDLFGEYDYEVIIQKCYFGPDTHRMGEKCILARKPGENVYTIDRAKEVAEHYCRIRAKHYPKHYDCHDD